MEEYILLDEELDLLQSIVNNELRLTRERYLDLILCAWRVIGKHHGFNYKTVEYDRCNGQVVQAEPLTEFKALP